MLSVFLFLCCLSVVRVVWLSLRPALATNSRSNEILLPGPPGKGGRGSRIAETLARCYRSAAATNRVGSRGVSCCYSNNNASQGTFYEGAIVAGYPSDTTDAAIQANIVGAGYGK